MRAAIGAPGHGFLDEMDELTPIRECRLQICVIDPETTDALFHLCMGDALSHPLLPGDAYNRSDSGTIPALSAKKLGDDRHRRGVRGTCQWLGDTTAKDPGLWRIGLRGALNESGEHEQRAQKDY